LVERDRHPLLTRQLKKLAIDPQQPPSCSAWNELVTRVSAVYHDADQERYLLERSQDLASKEMSDLYRALQAEHEQLEMRVVERTRELATSEARMRSLLSLSSDWFWEQDKDLRFTHISEGFMKASGIDPTLYIGRTRADLAGSDANAEPLASHLAHIAARRPFRDFVYKVVRSGAAVRYLSISGEPIQDDDGAFIGYRGVGRDVTRARLAEDQMIHMANYDGLTTLPNRNMFLKEFDRALARARRNGSRLAVFFLDLDRFKNINDSLGHAAGDELLQEMANRLRALLRENDLVARLGGDEFVILVEGYSKMETLSHIARKMLAAIARPCMVQGRELLVTGSLGASSYPEDGDEAATLLRNADTAMYKAKEQGKNNYQFYSAQLAAHASRQLTLETELRHAVERDELVLHYQPKFDLQSHRMVGVEALLRWNHPERGLLAPGDFIGLAEDSGLIVPIGHWVLRAACAQFVAWIRDGFDAPRCAVNLSARQFANGSVMSHVQDALESAGAPPYALEVEITESLLMTEPARAIETLNTLRAMGVHIAIDDFGTGYSSLAYLKRLPAHCVKIDRSFIEGLPGDRDDAAITQAVIAMAHSLDMQVVAEGVETVDQLRFLQQLGCDCAQGYFFSRPVPAEQLICHMERVSPLQTSQARASLDPIALDPIVALR
jgi:diguanylate cyclase (GGDEF)-like protein/PAS domain S-box-containing protein